jgi:hypothetical protein
MDVEDAVWVLDKHINVLPAVLRLPNIDMTEPM